jgi:Ca2+-transporting ATPase
MRRSVPVERINGLINDWQGLTAAEADQRRHQYGSNNIVETSRSGWLDLVRETGRDPMIWFLIGTALLFTWLGEYGEAATLAVAVVPIAGMDAYLHKRTLASTEGLASRLAESAAVVRDGRTASIRAVDLVPGDLVMVAEGTPFPADGLVVGGDGLQVDESALTGEAMPIRKAVFVGWFASEQAMVENLHWGSAGTRLLTGEAKLRVVHTGGETLYGQIVRSAQADEHERTPLQQAIGSLVGVLIAGAAIFCLALAAARYYQGHGAIDALLSAVTLAVAALPEEFPVVFTFFLGVGVYRLAQRQALVRRAVVVENIGRITCICSDKTGTLTEGRLHLTHVVPAEGIDRERLLRAAAVASREASSDPLDQAVLETVPKVDATVIATFPFTEDRRREVAIVQLEAGPLLCAAKGAPETIFAMSQLPDVERTNWQRRVQDLAAAGHKVIACAERAVADWAGGEPDRGYVLLGLLAFEDPVREGVADAVKRAQAAGIRVIMITGDHPATARTIAGEIGIGATPPRVIEGEDLASIFVRTRPAAIPPVDVIARAVPAQKLDLVRMLRQAGEIVAVTGDGVNDVPALQGADVGIAMGERGTRTAREVASIVLLDDNFRTIVRAIAEGRQLFENLRLSFTYLLMIHLPLVLTAALIPLAGFPLLYLPVHIVWLELIIHPTALLVFQQLAPAEPLQKVRRAAKLRFFSAWEWSVIGLVGGIITVAIALSYGRILGMGQSVEHARTMALVALIVASATVTAGLTRFQSRAALLVVALAIGSALAFVQIPFLARAFHLDPLHWDDWLVAAASGLVAGSLSAAFPWRQSASLQTLLVGQPEESSRQR